MTSLMPYFTFEARKSEEEKQSRFSYEKLFPSFPSHASCSLSGVPNLLVHDEKKESVALDVLFLDAFSPPSTIQYPFPMNEK